MAFLKKSLLVSTIIFTAALCAIPASGKRKGSTADNLTVDLDFNEETHLVFMREEEKLARDVYRTLGQKWQGAIAFSNIDDSEEQHTTTVRDKLLDYGISDPSTSDETGVFTGEDYGGYFTGKYEDLVEKGMKSLLDALYVGAFIEELDMLDIVSCPDAVIEAHESITLKSDCGLNYTDNNDIQRIYEALLEGSKNHLRSYVGNIEALEGECAYNPPALLDKDYFEEIVGRTCPEPEQ